MRIGKHGTGLPARRTEQAAAGVEDVTSREQITSAPQHLRSITVSNGEVEIMLHEISRALEHIADPNGWRYTAASLPAVLRHAWSHDRT